MAAIVAMGTVLKKGTQAVANLTSIAGLEISRDTIEVTTLDSPNGYRQFVGGLLDAGELSISGYFDYAAHSPLLDDLEAGTATTYTIEFPGGAKWTFTCVVTSFSTGAEMEDLVSFEASFKVSGKPTLAIVTTP
jgi:predicted secreted protein